MFNPNRVTVEPEYHRTSNPGHWKKLFEVMAVGEMWEVEKKDWMRVAQAATKHMRGRYTFKRVADRDVKILKKLK